MAVDENIAVDGIIPPHRQPIAPRGVRFTITSMMIQLLNLKGMFRGAAGDDTNQHLTNFVAICKSQEIPGMKDDISAHKKLPGEAMHDTWWRFSQKIKKCPNHGLTKRHLKQALYRSLNYVTKPVVDAVCGGSFMKKPFSESMQLMDKVLKNNRALYIRDAEVGDLGNDRSGVYVPSSNRDRASGSSSGSKLEDMLAKVLQKVKSTDERVKEMKSDFSSMSKLVDSHTTSIKQIEQQLGQQRKNRSLPSDTIQNPKKDRHCMAIATRSGKILTDPISVGTKHEHVLEQDGRKEDEAEQVDDLEDAQPIAKPAGAKEKEVERTLPLQQIPRPPHPFPQRLKKKVEDRKFAKFISMLRQLSVNIPLVEALEQMPRYAKFMKDLVTKKRAVSIDLTDNVHHCSVIATRSMVQKKEDPGAFTIPCTIESIEFAKDLCDLGDSINDAASHL
ncbi:uncharacterized protein [Solanum tuberosum]|uniref:uncharacterized protein n=1 Tax=Solanum tuberosum TaxID=4113 RepID=UPI00073A0ED0|nr:PREDICTED: uncharacterized protein LOC107060727 [Solanum tuberosum]